MGQEDIIKVLKKHQRLTTRQIAEFLNEKNLYKISASISKMIDREIKALKPTTEELQKLLDKYPTLKSKKDINIYVLIKRC